MRTDSYITKLRTAGERITPIRIALIKILASSKIPQTPQELLTELNKKDFDANKTTVYRQLETLQNFGIVREVHFTDRTGRFELADENDHHHHLVCVQCQRIEDISFPTDLDKQEKTIWRKNKFKVLHHSLEFFGTCRVCRLKTK